MNFTTQQRTETDLAALLSDAPDPTDHEGVRKCLRLLTEAGLSVLLIQPGSKEPFDGRTPRQRLADDKAAQKAAQAEGKRNWRKVKSPAGVYLATTDADVLDAYLDQYLLTFGADVAVNVAVAPGRSGLVVVDADTAEQVAAFLSDAGAPDDTPPTVSTPGQCDDAGEMVHSDGGHWWFSVPEGVVLPTDGVGNLSDPEGGYSVLWDRRYVLLPPSVRAEGSYVATGAAVHPLPEFLREKIIGHAEARNRRAERSRERTGSDPIESWGATITWAEILSDTGWSATGMADSCGCEVWTAPGDHASPKSATAHEAGCSTWTDSPDPPLHIWTDHDVEPFGAYLSAGKSTVSRLQAVAAIEFGNQIGAAMDALGLHDEPVTFDGVQDRQDDAGEILPEAASRDAAVSEAMAELRQVMADNADVLTSSEILTHVSQFADSRGAERYATVFGVLMRAVLAVPPQVVLPPIIGGEVSLNLLLAMVGASGAGKGTADKTAAAAVRLSLEGRTAIGALPMLPIGTGEGINRTYAHSERDKVSGQTVTRWHTDRALFGCRDIAAFNAVTTRQGSTLVPELLKAYMGEELGFANADKDRRVILPMHSYRLCLSAGVQPDNATGLLNDQAQRDGVPQRFLWAPVRPGVARDRRTAANRSTVSPLTVAIPSFGIDPWRVEPEDEYNPDARPLVPIGVASFIAREIIDADAAKDLDPFGRSVDPLAGHRLLAQLKLAAALAVLHRRTDVNGDDWIRAQRLLSVSSAVSRAVVAASTTAAEHEAVRRGQLDGHRLAAADEMRDAAKLTTVRDRILRHLGQQTGWVSQGAVNRGMSSKHRRYLDEAIESLKHDKAIQSREFKRNGQSGTEYRIRGK